jgi:ABC-type uncharacterized transport system permease subunit
VSITKRTGAAERPAVDVEDRRRHYRRAAVAGLLAGLAFGAMVQVGLNRMTAIGALYTLGEPSLSVGWLAHLAHSVAFGTLFALVVDVARRHRLADDVLTGPAMGLASGAALCSVNIVFGSLWLGAVGYSGSPEMPNLAVLPLVGHLVGVDWRATCTSSRVAGPYTGFGRRTATRRDPPLAARRDGRQVIGIDPWSPRRYQYSGKGDAYCRLRIGQRW